MPEPNTVDRPDVDALAEEWGDELRYLGEESDGDWEELDNSFVEESRWCNHYRKVLRHKPSGMTLAVEYATDVGDGDSAATYNDEGYEVEEYEETVTRWRRLGGSPVV